MLSERDEGLLRDILRQIDLANGFLEGIEFAVFERDTLRVYGVTRCLEIISEASRRVSDSLKVRHPEIPCKAMAGAGNIYRHNYLDVASRQVWNTPTLSLPVLRAVIDIELGTA